LPHDEVLSLGANQGTNDFGTVGYGPACPPRLRKHRYLFTLYALDKDIIVPPGARRQQVIAALKGHVLDEARIKTVYERQIIR
jgi:Raf kinase inhibitor-like YbhB/YbcL family protein